MLNEYHRLSDDRVEVRFAAPDRVFAKATAESLCSAVGALASYFELDTAFPQVHAFLAHDRDAFDTLVADVLKIEIERPSDPRRVAQPQRTDIVLLSPPAYADQSAYEYVAEDYARMVHHELVHVFEEYLSPDIEESPLWWGEGLAVYLSGQWQYESQFAFREPVLAAIQDGSAPSLSSVLEDPSLAYSFGWTIVRFIEHTMGSAAIVHAVRTVGDGDVLSSLGEGMASFEQSWHAWLLRGEGANL